MALTRRGLLKAGGAIGAVAALKPIAPAWAWNTSQSVAGGDLETLPPVTDRDIPWQVLSSAERRSVQALPQGEQFMEFLRLWTLKEAYTKYFGMGAALDFRGVQVDLDPLQATTTEARDPRLVDPMLHQQLLRIGGQTVVFALAAGRPRE